MNSKSGFRKGYWHAVAGDLPISRKFFFAFGTVCGLCIFLGVFTFVTFHKIAIRSVDVSDDSFPSAILLSDIRGAVNAVRREDLELLLCQTPACSANHNAIRQQAITEYEAGVKTYESLISYPGERELYQKFSTSLAQYIDASNRANALLASQDRRRAGSGNLRCDNGNISNRRDGAFGRLEFECQIWLPGVERSYRIRFQRHLDQHRSNAADRAALRSDRHHVDPGNCAAAAGRDGCSGTRGGERLDGTRG